MLRLVLVAAVISLVTARTTESPKKDSTTRRNLQIAFDWFEVQAKNITRPFNEELAIYLNNNSLTQWNYYTNMTDENQAAIEKAAKIGDHMFKIAEQTNHRFWDETIKDKHIKRQLKKISKKFVIRAPTNEMLAYGYSNENLQSTISQMKEIYNTAKICDFTNKTKCDLAVKEVKEIMSSSRDPEELKHIWVEWRKATGEQVKSLYPKYVEYVNIKARLRDFPDQAAYWISSYEVDNFTEQIENVWQQLKPLYLQLHAYVRRELRKKYGEDIVSKDGPIPAHLLGNMWAQSWSNIADFTAPFLDKKMPNVTTALLEQGYNATSIFRLAEDFYKSINLSAMPDTFWERSILEKPENVNMSCVARAWDFYDGKDFRISQCTRVDMESLLTAHHGMALIEYAMQYKDQPAIFKEGANPVFHEAVANALTLMVSTPRHLEKIGLLTNNPTEIGKAFRNHLYLIYLMSLDKIALLPFAYINDLWRWNVFQGNVTPDNYNCHWWSLVAEYQGIEPPVDRSEEDFDLGSNYDIIANVDYIKHFVSQVLQFHIHRRLCIINDPRSIYPLHKCDIYGNRDAGQMLKRMLKLGSSKPWPDAMGDFVNHKLLNAIGLLEYFRPLEKWLTEENKKTNEYIGWKPSNKRCVRTREELTIRKTSDEL